MQRSPGGFCLEPILEPAEKLDTNHRFPKGRSLSSAVIVPSLDSVPAFSRDTLASPELYRPVQRGFRFSKNELTPSRKSSVVRMRAFSSTASAICRSNSSDE